ncbi:MAG: hypothetical protein NZ898_06625 [Myxococcota bacterium]|nr:hypothetical protein [Myxococcota bacterium]MDW8362423.1 GH25 family lysozyme [Myxococcales bacterium]
MSRAGLRCCLLSAIVQGTAAGCAEPSDPIAANEQYARICADGPTLPGIDVSHWQGRIDWDAVAGAGIRFAFIRVSDGTGTMDREFHRNWPEARRVGIVRGVYQFFRPNQDPIAQADLLLDRIGTLEPDDMSPVIDVEVTGDRTASQIVAAMRAWIDRVEAATRRRVIIYTAPYFWRTSVGNSDAFASNPLWIANWGVRCPDVPEPWSDWAFWQTSDSGRVAGISGNVDTNEFDGTPERLRGFGTVGCTPRCEGSVLVGADCGRGDCAAFGARCVDDAHGARCVFHACPDTGEADVCLDEHTIAHCRDGRIETGDCGAFAAYCSTAGRAPTQARCVSVFCVPDAASPPVAHDGCWIEGGKLLHCDENGVPTLEECPPGQACSMVGGRAHCAPGICPLEGETDACVDDRWLGHCLGGSIARATDCEAMGARCVAGPDRGRCEPVARPPERDAGGTGEDCTMGGRCPEPVARAEGSCTCRSNRGAMPSAGGLALAALALLTRTRRHPRRAASRRR